MQIENFPHGLASGWSGALPSRLDSPRTPVVAFGAPGYADSLARPLEIGAGSLRGVDTFGPGHNVTRAAGNALHDLDGRPALAISFVARRLRRLRAAQPDDDARRNP
jgi:hypothetical protein